MKRKGMQTKELAAAAGISVNTLNMYIGYRSSIPSAEIAVRLARALSVTVEYLIEGKNTVAVLPAQKDYTSENFIYNLVDNEIREIPRDRMWELLAVIRDFKRTKLH